MSVWPAGWAGEVRGGTDPACYPLLPPDWRITLKGSMNVAGAGGDPAH